MKSVCVFCASNPGTKPEYMELARSVGRLLAARQMTVVFGGGRVGLMGALANAALQAGGQVIGVMPHALVLCARTPGSCYASMTTPTGCLPA